MRNVGGLSQTEAQKCSDIFMKCLYFDEITGEKGTVFATGTPVSNSMADLYTMQRYLQYGELRQNFMNQKYALQDKVLKHYPEEITRLNNKIAAMEEDTIKLQE